MTYEEAEKLDRDNWEKIKHHNTYLVDSMGFKVKETLIAPVDSGIDTLSKIFINKTVGISNRDSISLLGFDFDKEQYEVFLYTETYYNIFSSQSLSSYLEAGNKPNV